MSKFYLSLFLVSIASFLILERLRKFAHTANRKSQIINWKVLVWDILVVVMAILLIKYEGDFILSLIGQGK
jgi:hypothetical protein